MIIAIYLRYIKTYRGLTYIPLSYSDKFCGLVGENGIGKSSVLEALDSFFNDKPQNFNFLTKKRGLEDSRPEIVPIFLVKKDEINDDLKPLAELLDKLARVISETDVIPSYKSDIKNFITHRQKLTKLNKIEDHYLLPIGIDYADRIALTPFNCRKLVELHIGHDTDPEINKLSQNELQVFQPLLTKIRTIIEYIHIPKEIDSESFTKLETAEIQSLMGETLNEIIEERVTPATIKDINNNLNQFIQQISAKLEIYSYRTPHDRQQQIKKQDVYNLIIQAFFSIRKLHKKQGEHWLEISSLSSGEKQKAIIDVAHKLISEHRPRVDNLIIAIDEPEASLHMSACFDQFSALYKISRHCMQLLFSTHWYGFLPTIETGNAAVISKKDGEHVVDLIDIANHREQVKQMSAESKGTLPYDIRLKSINDFVQSIITSSMSSEPFNWLICEGSSEKLYFSEYFKDLVSEKRLRIIPVGGAKEIKRLYQHLSLSHEEFKEEIKGKIVLISDTDAELVSYETKNFPRLICKRIVNSEAKKDTALVNISANLVSPPTEIEDALNGQRFRETLLLFSEEFPDLKFIHDLSVTEGKNSFFAIDLRPSERDLVRDFFDTGNNKFLFAKEYISADLSQYTTPQWINEIRSLFED